MGGRWCCAGFLKIRLGGPNIRRPRARCADPGDGAQINLHRDRSSASLIDLRRRLRAVLDVIGSIRGSGFSAMGEGSSFCLQGTFTEEQLVVVSVLGLPGMGDAVGAAHDELDRFLRAVVVRRRDWAVQGWSACVIY